jgi:hypothetical protein
MAVLVKLEHMMRPLLLALLLSAGSAVSAHAVSLTYAGSTTHTLAGFDLSATTGLSNGTLIFKERNAGDGLYLSGPATLKITYLGKEAGDTNAFRMPGTTEIFRTSTAAVGNYATVTSAGGLLNFNFLDLSVFCAAAISNGAGNSIHQNAIGVFMESLTSAIVLFNDFGGDRDYDDMAIRIQVSPVPVPAALPLFATALAGVGVVARRRKHKANKHTA